TTRLLAHQAPYPSVFSLTSSLSPDFTHTCPRAVFTFTGGKPCEITKCIPRCLRKVRIFVARHTASYFRSQSTAGRSRKPPATVSRWWTCLLQLHHYYTRLAAAIEQHSCDGATHVCT